MKKIFSFVAAALMSASLFAGPAAVPTVQDVATAGFDVANARVIVIYFDEQVCNDIVWAGSYNGWSTTPDDMSKFEPLENYPGWYVVEVFDERAPQADQTVDPANNCCVGKPVQLKKDGSFSWDFQAGDADAWIDMAQSGSKQNYIYGGLPGEADVCWNEYGAYIYEVAYFKTHNTPCGADKPKHNYSITAYLPDFCDEIAAYADSARVMGGFDSWGDGIWMTKTYDEDFNMIWTATLNDVEEGTEFKLRFGTDADWAVQVRKDGQNLGNEMTGETTDIILQFDGEGYDFAACAAPVPAADYQITVTFPTCEYAVPGVIGDFNSWATAEVMTLATGNTYIITLTQATGSIKFRDARYNDWSSQIQVLGEDGETWSDMGNYILNPEETIVVLDYSDETKYRWTSCEETALEEIKATKEVRRAYMVEGQIYFKAGDKVFNVLGAEVK